MSALAPGEVWVTACGGCGERIESESPAPAGSVIGVTCAACGRAQLTQLPGSPARQARERTAKLQRALLAYCADVGPRLTIRQLFYAMEVRGLVPKDRNGYRAVQYALVQMRRRGLMPYGWLADNTRWHIKPRTYRTLNDALALWHEAYRRDLWASQAAHVEIWVEKDALAGVVSPITTEYDVPLFVARGFSSVTFAYDAAEQIKATGKPAYIYHFGDMDPSGRSAAQSVARELERHGAEIHFEIVAVTAEQVERLHLPTRGVKRSDTRARRWPYPYSCELDALPPAELRRLVGECIQRHVDARALASVRQAEALERETLGNMANLVLVPNGGSR